MISSLRQENSGLREKLKETERNLKALNENLQRMRNQDTVTVEALETRQQQKQQKNSTLEEEKKQLKKDAKELCNINDRLRNKLKELTKSYGQLKTGRKEEKSELFEQLQKARQSIRQLEDDIKSRQRDFEREKTTLECRVEEHVNRCNEVFK